MLRGNTVRRVVGFLLVALGGIPLSFLPPVVVWAVLECGPVDSSCHHFPYRLIIAATGAASLFGTSFWLLTRCVGHVS